MNTNNKGLAISAAMSRIEEQLERSKRLLKICSTKGNVNMSYYFEIADKSFNYTYNVSVMLYKAMPEHGIRVINGKCGEEAVKFLLTIYNYMVINSEALKELNPPNGWGSYEGALALVHKLIEASLTHPDDLWKVD